MQHSTAFLPILASAFSGYRGLAKILGLLTLLTLISSCGGGGSSNDTSRLAAPSNFQISEVADAGLTLSWKQVTNASSYTVYYQLGEGLSTASAATTETKQTSIVLKGLSNYSTYTFAVNASNASTSSVLSSIQGLAGIRITEDDRIKGFQATAADAQVQLEWQALAGASTYLLSYFNDTGEDQTIETTNTKQLIDGLTNGKNYSFSIFAINPLDRSKVVQTQARPYRPTTAPESPTDLKVINYAEASIQLTWQAVTGASTYTLYYQLGEDLNTASATMIETEQTSIVLKNLINYSSYTIAVSASNAIGSSGLSASIQEKAGIRIAEASQVQGLQATAGDAQVELAWQPLLGATTYVLSYSGMDATTQTIHTAQTEWLIEDLTNGSTYTFSITAINPLNRSRAVQTQAKPLQPTTLPQVPTDLTAIGYGLESIQLTWQAVTGASTYTLYYQLGEDFSVASAATTETKQTSIVLKNLINYSVYTVAVSASNQYGESDLSAAIQAVAGIRIAEASQVQGLQATAGDGQVELAWQPLLGVTTYVLSYSGMDATTQTIYTAQTERLIEDLTNGSTYTFSITAINPIGESQPNQIQASPLPPRVTTPVKLRVTNYLDQGLKLAWDKVEGASTYTLYYQLGESLSTASARSTQTKQTQISLENLSNYSSYTLAVSASNLRGNSELSANIQERVGIRLTDFEVQGLQATAGDGEVELAWKPLLGATTYVLSYSGVDATTQTIYTAQTERLIEDLTNGSTYTFSITAINPIGQSNPNQVQARPLPAVPIAPNNLRVTDYFDEGLGLAWDKVEGASTYTLYYQLGEDLGGAATTETDQTSIVLKNLINYRTYSFTVRASNAFFSSEPSSSIQERIGIRLSIAPWDLTASLDQGSIKLSWSGIAGATTYRIHYQWVNQRNHQDTSTTEITLTNLTPDRIYSFRVQGINPVSVSAFSESVREGVFSNTALTITPIQGQQTLEFSWDEASGVDYYRLLSNLGTGGGFEDASTTGFVVSPSSTYLKQNTATARLGLHQYVPLTNGPVYRLEGCSDQVSDQANTCNRAIGTAVVDQQQLNQLIGYIKASNPDQDDEFGRSIALSGDGNTLAVGAYWEDGSGRGVNSTANNSLKDSGAVYVYTKENGVWSDQVTYIKASNSGGDDAFGYSVALSDDGNTLAVGALREDGSGTGINPVDNDDLIYSGAVYVYTRENGIWSNNITYIKANNSASNDLFGWSVALSGDGNTLAVGSIEEDGRGIDQAANNLPDSGAVYVYTRKNGSWSDDITYIKAKNPGQLDRFGWSIALSGDGNTLAVGAIREDGSGKGISPAENDDLEDSGAVYVYAREDGVWSTQATYIKASNPDADDNFGQSIALSDDGNTLAVGALREDGSGKGITPAENDDLGDSGAVYVYTRENGIWSDQVTYIKASNSDIVDLFGYSVSLSGDGSTLAVGAPFEYGSGKGINPEHNNYAKWAGAVYVYTGENGVWSDQITYLKASNSGKEDNFGWSVSLSGDGSSLAVGARDEDGNGSGVNSTDDDNNARNSGAVYLY